MSSNLTISYTSQIAAGNAPSGAAAADAPAADSPLGFLAALIDQLLAGGTEAATATASGEASTDVPVPGLLDLTFGTPSDTEPAPTDTDLLTGLVGQLNALQSRLDLGEAPSPDQLKKLTDAIEALSAALAGPNTTAANVVPPSGDAAVQLRDQLLVLSQSVAATSPALSRQLEALASKLPVQSAPQRQDELTVAQVIRALLGEAPANDDPKPADAPAPSAELMQILASLGINVPTDSAIAPAPVTGSAAASPDLMRLSSQLSKLSVELADKSPDLAQKLDAVATQLLSVDADPKLFAQLSSAASDPDGAALDKLVQSLIDSKPTTPPLPATPQIAVSAKLEIPAPIAPKQSKSAVTEVKAAPPQPAPVTADSAPPPAVKVAAEQIAATTGESDTQPKADAKIVADTGKADTAPMPSPQPATAPALVSATQARPLPAAYQPVANPINMGQMAFEMVRQVHQGTTRFTIRLDPPEMGRVDVRMHVDPSGTVNARLIVDRAETLDMFQRDQRTLERALAQAGLDSSKTNLEFSLRQNPFGNMAGGDQRQQHTFGNSGARFSLAQSDEQPSAPAITLYRGIASAGGVNIFA